MTLNEKTTILGDEYDDELRQIVQDVLLELGASPGTHFRGVAGSQDIETIEIDVEGKPLVLESETYVGLSVRGDEELVDRVESLVKARLGGGHP
jgi:hypothetical protein